jgi:hypothetical protein
MLKIFIIFSLILPLALGGCAPHRVDMQMYNTVYSSMETVIGINANNTLTQFGGVPEYPLFLSNTVSPDPGDFYITANGQRVAFYHESCVDPVRMWEVGLPATFQIIGGKLYTYVKTEGWALQPSTSGPWYCLYNCPTCTGWIKLPVGEVEYRGQYYITDGIYNASTASSVQFVLSSSSTVVSWDDAICYTGSPNAGNTLLENTFLLQYLAIFLVILKLF